MVDSIAQGAMAMSASQFSVAYATGVTKMAMKDQEEMAMSMINEMMPPAPSVMMGNYIDTYA